MKEKLPEAPQLPGRVRDQFMALAPDRSALLDRVSTTGQYAETKPVRAGTARIADDT
jgi:hypothetical protein